MTTPDDRMPRKPAPGPGRARSAAGRAKGAAKANAAGAAVGAGVGAGAGAGAASRQGPTRIAVRSLGARGGNPFELRPDAPLRRRMAAELGLAGLRKLRLAGTITPLDCSDWQLDAMLGATCVQDCVVTGRPVTTRIDRPVRRVFRTEMPPPPPPGSETQFDGDDETEPLGEWIDLAQIMHEELSLALPDYPRAPDADLAAILPPEPGEAASDAAPSAADPARPSPFAVLAVLREGAKSVEDDRDDPRAAGTDAARDGTDGETDRQGRGPDAGDGTGEDAGDGTGKDAGEDAG